MEMKKTKTNKRTPNGEKTQETTTKKDVTGDLQDIIKKRNDKKTITLSFEKLKP
jgi:hypothetical protein